MTIMLVLDFSTFRRNLAQLKRGITRRLTRVDALLAGLIEILPVGTNALVQFRGLFAFIPVGTVKCITHKSLGLIITRRFAVFVASLKTFIAFAALQIKIGARFANDAVGASVITTNHRPIAISRLANYGFIWKQATYVLGAG